MIGNDVIDILQSRQESNWQRKGFLEKLFTVEEQALITKALNPEIRVWILWSMKEAAYKIYNRQTKIRAYIPQKLVCSLVSESSTYISGKVSCLGTVYYTQTFIHKEYLHTIAVNHPAQWDMVIEIEKKNVAKDQHGIPFLSADPSSNRQNVSVSNHGRYEKVVGFKA